MNRLITSLLFVMAYVLANGQNLPKSYVCYQSTSEITVDGKLEKSEWGKAKWTDLFVDIEGDKKAKPTYKTRVKMLWDEKYFYFAAELQDAHIWAKLKQRDTVIFYDNDFEIFIDPQGDNHMYYEFEMNALNTVWDLMLVKPYRNGGPAINSWDIKGLKTGVEIYGTLNDPSDKDKKWTLEVAMPWESLKECAPGKRMPKDGEQWRVNFSRVQWSVGVLDGIYYKKLDSETGKVKNEHNWVWSPQGVIDMHQPEKWGFVQFSENIVGGEKVEFVEDIDFPVKMALLKVYEMQKKYQKITGKYADAVNTKVDVQVEATSKQFLAYAKGASGKMWYINQDSKIWSE